MSIRGLFERGTTAIIDVTVLNLDSQSSIPREPAKALVSREKEKISKYKDICESRRESFHPFAVSADGMLAPQATKLLQRLASLTAEKTQRPYSTVMQFLRQRFSIALVKAVHLCLRTTRSNKPKRRLTPSQSQTLRDHSSEYKLMHG